MRRFDKLALRLSKSELPLSNILHVTSQIEALNLTKNDELEELEMLGFPIIKTSENYATLKTRLTAIEEQEFCIVDIETSASDTNSGQIIEIGALMIKDGKEVDRFDSLVYANSIPQTIQELTGIEEEALHKAPSLATVLEKFRLFLKDAVFVAHNVNFDYSFISATLEKLGFGPLLNRKLCTIDLAKKTLKAERYGLEHLKEVLKLDEGELHRAFWDAYYATEIFKKSLQNISKPLYTTEELLFFAKPNEKKRKPSQAKKRAKTTNNHSSKTK